MFPKARTDAHGQTYRVRGLQRHTLLVKNEDIATVQVDGVGGTETGHWKAQDGQSMRGRHERGQATHIHHRQ